MWLDIGRIHWQLLIVLPATVMRWLKMLACIVIGAVCLVFKGLLIYCHIVLICYHQLSSYYQSIVFQIRQPINCFWNKWKTIIIKQIVCVVILMHTNNRNKLLFQRDRKGESYDSPEIPGTRVPSDISGDYSRGLAKHKVTASEG